METQPTADPGEPADLIRRAGLGDHRALDELFTRHQERLLRTIRLRMNPRLRGRVDPSDVLQEAYLEAAAHLPGYLSDPKIPLFFWLRHLAIQKLIQVHRQHLGARMRAVGREVSLRRDPPPAASTASLAAQLIGRFTSPSMAAEKSERRHRLQEALNAMDEIDREILTLRHFEQFSNAEAARELDLSPSAASKRYVRALERLQKALGGEGDR